MHFLQKRKMYHLISKNECSITLLQKELEKLKNYIIVLIFKISYIILRISLKIYISTDDEEKHEIEFESKLSSVIIVGNKLDKQLSKLENITKFINCERLLKFIMIVLKWCIKLHLIQKMENDSKC